jgi:DNA-binding LacI/PurR family transcriptional regulator
MLGQAGLRIPHDVALIRFDDMPAASMIEPALATVCQPVKRMGSVIVVVDLLMNLLDGDWGEIVPRTRSSRSRNGDQGLL